ncbi:LysR family transcriptional regulator [Aquabacter spiritensis]|uniref:DNA-binding transcriptional LysR family regulator n=1 Tax=Aquabacter spiritensis TaxID=933073 RepID=A0A4R3LSX7_9HYPH|nr:LysR family transcriptional regulator [Aquabacter spiritensis]TCT01715.1 DNA-binding transcriptional LysR family regulator [Aquabacter spiritensis]
MNWDNVRIFLAVARSGQILGAARKLGLDHATVSRRIAALEAELHSKLLERGTAGCTLTRAGDRLLAIAERAETSMLQVESELTSPEVELEGVVRVGAPEGFGSYFLAAELGALSLKHPKLTLQVVPLTRTFSLANRDADIIITFVRPTRGRIVAKQLVTCSLNIYASQTHLKEFGPVRTLDDVAGRCLVTYVGDLIYSPPQDYSAELRQLMPIRFECASVIAQLEAVRSGAGIGVLHGYGARRYADLVQILPERSFYRTYWIAARDDVRELPRVAAVHRYIVRRVQGQTHLFQ